MITDARILVADDDRELTHAIGVRLRAVGHRVTFANDAYNALACAALEHPQVLLLDVHLPGGDGFNVHERLCRMAGMQMPAVIYLTGDRSLAVARQSGRLGAHTVLYKPVDAHELLEAIERALVSRAA